MPCTCSSFCRYAIVFISIGSLIFSIFFFIGFGSYYNHQPWFIPIRNYCIPYYLCLFTVVILTIYAIIGIALGISKKKKLYYLYLALVSFSILMDLGNLVVILCFKDQNLRLIEKNWRNNKYRENRLEFEFLFTCCGFFDYNPKDECGFHGQKGYYCGYIVDIELIEYFAQLRSIVIYFLLVKIVPIILISFLVCCNNEDENVFDTKELESTTSLYNNLIN